MTFVAGYAGYQLWYKLLNIDPSDFSKVYLAENNELKETETELRDCLPTDEEDTFNSISKEECINPSELIIPDDKMMEYIDPKCSKLEDDVRI